MGRISRLLSARATDVGGLGVPRRGTGPHDGQRRGKISDAAHGQPAQDSPHGRRLDLKTANGPALTEGRTGGGVAVRHRGHAPQRLTRLLEGAQGAVAEQIDLDEPDPGQRCHVELGDEDALGRSLDRHVAVDARLGDHHAAGMDGDMLEHADEPLDQGRRGTILLGQKVKGKRQLALQLVRGQAARELIDIDAGHAEGLQALPKGGAPAKRLVRGRHGHALLAEPVEDPLQELVSSMRRHIDVDVREVLPSGVEEALEIQAVLDRVDGGDVEEVCDQRSYRRAAAHHGDTLLSGMAGDLAHDQEVAGERAVADHRELMAQARLVLSARAAAVSRLALEPRAANLREASIGRLAGGEDDRGK